jgi:hypothetical protein
MPEGTTPSTSSTNMPQTRLCTNVISLKDLCLDLVAHLLGISQEHLCVLLVEHRVISACVSDAHCALHKYDLLGLPDLDHGGVELTLHYCYIRKLLLVHGSEVRGSS